MKIAVLILLLFSSFSTNAYKFIVYYGEYVRVYESEKLEAYGLFGLSIQRLCENSKYIERITDINGKRDVYRKHSNDSHIKCEILQEND